MNPILFLLFFLSGFCGLLYQVVWLRLAFASFGIITPVLSVVVSVFMLGLALGSWGAGRWVSVWRRRSGVSSVWFYAVAEVVIGAGAFAVPALFRSGRQLLLPLGDADSASYLIVSALILGASILPFCIAMGTTFPLMMGFVRETMRGEKESFSYLYLGNVIGAATGTLLTAVLLVELLGFATTLLVGAITNLTIAAISAWLGTKHPLRVSEAEEEITTAVADPTTRTSWALTILFLTGFSSMGFEVIWTRAFAPVLGTWVYSFASLLFVYLVSTATGSWLYRRHVSRQQIVPTTRLLVLIAAAGFLPVVLNDPQLIPSGGLDVALALISIVPFCGCLGYLTPKLVDRYAAGQPRPAGRAYAVNVLGCILGPLVVCYAVLPTIGARLGMILLAAPFILLLLPRWNRAETWRLPGMIASAALLAVSLSFSRSYEEGTSSAGAEVRRDHTATAIAWGEGLDKRLQVNGIAITELTPVTKLMAHWPLAVHEEPESSLVICFGMGTTYRSSLSWDVDTTAVELARCVVDSFPFFFEDGEELLRHPRGTIVIDDGRRFLQRSTKTYDVITIDPPPPPETAGSSLLYSNEFYELVKQRLSEDGLLQHWVPAPPSSTFAKAVVRSVVESFPQVRAFTSFDGAGIHLMAAMNPIAIPPPDQLAARFPARAKEDLLEWNAAMGLPVDLTFCLEYLLGLEVDPHELLHEDVDIRITDDRPFNEYFLLRRFLQGMPR